MLDIRLSYASICKRVAGAHSLGDLFLARYFFLFWTVCIFFGRKPIFNFNFWDAASIVSLGEAKNGVIFGIKFWFRVWRQNLSFWSLWQVLLGDTFSLVRIRVKFEAISSFTVCPCNVNKKHELRTALQHEADEL